MMKKVKLVALSLLLVITSGVMVACKSNGKIPDPGGEFSYDTVSVQLTVAASDAATSAGHVFTPADFPELALSEVLAPSGTPLGERRSLFLTLENPGRENILRAIYQLRARNDVYSATISPIGL